MNAPIRKRLGEILIERGKLDAAGLDRALRIQEDSGEKLGVLLVTLGVVAQRDVSEALADQLGLPLVEAASYPELPILEERVSARFLRESRALPLAEDETELALAMADPTDEYTVNAFEMVTGRKVRPQVAIPMELEAALEQPGCTPGSYTTDHSAGTLIYYPQGRLRVYVGYGQGPDVFAHDIRELLHASGGTSHAGREPPGRPKAGTGVRSTQVVL